MKISSKISDLISFGAIGGSGLKDTLSKTGRLPPVTIVINPLDGSKQITLNRFLSYQFSSSILIPVDTFSFTYVAPDSPKPTNSYIKDGDIAVLYANNRILATGIIDQSEVEIDQEFGEKGTLSGRDLMSQMEDNDAISLDSQPIYANQTSVQNGVRLLVTNTRIRDVKLQGAPTGANWLLATEPGESKLAALQRFIEPLNCLSWMSPEGYIIVGRPNMSQASSGKLILNKSRRDSNVLSMKATTATTRIPGAIVPIWSAQEDAVFAVSKMQALMNGATGPSRLWKLGHRVIKTVVVSTPQGGDPQSLSQINGIIVSNFNQSRAGGGPLLNAYAKRDFARYNQTELIVQVSVPGHYNDNGEPYKVDTVYSIDFDRGGVQENMYCYQVDYTLDLSGGQRTLLYFCKLGTIVSDVVAPGSGSRITAGGNTGGSVA